MVTFTINGSSRSFDGDADMPLLWYLRDELGLTGTKFGCGGGFCGACTVHVDGKAVRSCLTPMRALDGAQGRHHRGAERRPEAPGAGAPGCEQTSRSAATARPARSCRPRRCSAKNAASDRRRHRRRHGWQHLPLRHLSAHPRGDQARGGGSGMTLTTGSPTVVTTNVSRRHFLGGMFSAGAFVVAARFVPESLLAQTAVVSHAGRRGGAPSQRLSGHRSRRHGAHRDAPLGDGHGYPHLAPHGRRRRARCRLGPSEIEQGVGDARYGDQNTDGSKSIRDFFDAFRQAGASARAMLIQAAAAEWQVPVAECETGLHEVVHKPSGRRAAVRSARAGGCQAARAEVRHAPVQAAECLALHRQGSRGLRPRRHRERQGGLRNGRQSRRNGVRLDRAPAGARRDAEVGGRQGGARRPGVRQVVTLDAWKPRIMFQPLGAWR